jgi:hypothetical protein
MIPVYDLKIPRHWIREDVARGIAGDWWIVKDCDFVLHTTLFDGLEYEGMIIGNGGEMRLIEGYEWNGSNVVPDKMQCLIPSAFHDGVCGALKAVPFFRRLKLRWQADKWYATYCEWQGLGKIRSSTRAAGLHLRQIIWPF